MDAQLRLPLVDALTEHIKRNPISFHVPGHKYGRIFPNSSGFFQAILQLDATELSGLDDLHAPDGVILEAEDLLTNLFQVKKSYFLVNGSTVGNLAMVMTGCSEDDIVLVQRNCHKSIINALQLAKATPIFIEPEYDPDGKVAAGVEVTTVNEALLLYPQAKAIILTYPNYYGMVYDLKGIIDVAHDRKIPVLVDEAHGAHFIVGGPFPKSAVSLGADIVVQSAHKTLPAMTMGSFLHFNSELLSNHKVKNNLEIFQSSSPSYPIMASLDIARHYLAAYREEDISYLLKKITEFKKQLKDISAIKVVDFHGDPLKITVQSRCRLNGFELQKELELRSIFPELADPNNVLFIFPLLKNGQEYLLEEAAAKIKRVLADLPFMEREVEYVMNEEKISRLAVSYQEMTRLTKKVISIEESAGHISAEQIIPYPPGIPLLLPGERITGQKLAQLQRLVELGARFHGGPFVKQGQIEVFHSYRT